MGKEEVMSFGHAVLEGDESRAIFLLEKGYVTVDDLAEHCTGHWPMLNFALVAEREDIIRELVRRGADINGHHESDGMIYYAIGLLLWHAKKPATLRLLEDLGATGSSAVLVYEGRTYSDIEVAIKRQKPDFLDALLGACQEGKRLRLATER